MVQFTGHRRMVTLLQKCCYCRSDESTKHRTNTCSPSVPIAMCKYIPHPRVDPRMQLARARCTDHSLFHPHPAAIETSTFPSETTGGVKEGKKLGQVMKLTALILSIEMGFNLL